MGIGVTFLWYSSRAFGIGDWGWHFCGTHPEPLGPFPSFSSPHLFPWPPRVESWNGLAWKYPKDHPAPTPCRGKGHIPLSHGAPRSLFSLFSSLGISQIQRISGHKSALSRSLALLKSLILGEENSREALLTRWGRKRLWKAGKVPQPVAARSPVRSLIVMHLPSSPRQRRPCSGAIWSPMEHLTCQG